jgi:hypothetical protein
VESVVVVGVVVHHIAVVHVGHHGGRGVVLPDRSTVRLYWWAWGGAT